MTPEGRVKAAIKKVLKGYRPLWYYMPVPSGYGKMGVPDFIVCANGFFFSIEAKAEGGLVTALQIKTHNEIAAANGLVIVVSGESDACMIESYLHFFGCQRATTSK